MCSWHPVLNALGQYCELLSHKHTGIHQTGSTPLVSMCTTSSLSVTE
jgi:hypothetical protein